MGLSEKRSQRWRPAVVAVASAVWLLFGATASATADFCESQMIRDYTTVLKHLPAIPPPPLDEQLDFAPAQVFLGHPSSGPLQVGRGERRFALTFGPFRRGRLRQSSSRLAGDLTLSEARPPGATYRPPANDRKAREAVACRRLRLRDLGETGGLPARNRLREPRGRTPGPIRRILPGAATEPRCRTRPRRHHVSSRRHRAGVPAQPRGRDPQLRAVQDDRIQRRGHLDHAAGAIPPRPGPRDRPGHRTGGDDFLLEDDDPNRCRARRLPLRDGDRTLEQGALGGSPLDLGAEFTVVE